MPRGTRDAPRGRWRMMCGRSNGCVLQGLPVLHAILPCLFSPVGAGHAPPVRDACNLLIGWTNDPNVCRERACPLCTPGKEPLLFGNAAEGVVLLFSREKRSRKAGVRTAAAKAAPALLQIKFLRAVPSRKGPCPSFGRCGRVRQVPSHIACAS